MDLRNGTKWQERTARLSTVMSNSKVQVVISQHRNLVALSLSRHNRQLPFAVMFKSIQLA